MLIALLIVGLGLVSLLTLRGKHKGMQMEMEHKTAQSLAQAKAVLLGRAVSDGDPGTLACPGIRVSGSVNGAASTSGNDCEAATAPSNIPLYWGYLPWKTLGVGDLYDGAGERLWYVLSPNFIDKGEPILPSTAGTISVNGGPANIAAVIISPGAALSGQSRAGADATVYTNYLESYVNSTTINTTLNTSNDQIITITASEVKNLITQRAAREFAKAVTTYATSHSGNYPSILPLTEGIDWLTHFSKWNNSAVTRFTLDGANPQKGTLEFPPCTGSFVIQRVGTKDEVSGKVSC